MAFRSPYSAVIRALHGHRASMKSFLASSTDGQSTRATAESTAREIPMGWRRMLALERELLESPALTAV